MCESNERKCKLVCRGPNDTPQNKARFRAYREEWLRRKALREARKPLKRKALASLGR